MNKRPSQRLQRPNRRKMTVEDGLTDHQQLPPPEENQVKRQASRGRLLGIFTRNRSSKSSSPLNESRAGSRRENVGQDNDNTSSVWKERKASTTTETNPQAPNEVDKQPSAKQKRSKSFKKASSPSKSVPWDPPPLFQAYPQAVKHATLSAPSTSADAVLRFQSDAMKKHRKKDAMSDARQDDAAEDDEKGGPLHHAEWSQKVYVLVTSGYFLQYAGEGSFDRLPERIMPLGTDSAAFASDAIPGKHWVLQISHALDENGDPRIFTSWSILRRLGLRGEMKRASASNFLLVLDNPEDLDDWLSVVRKEIEAWGGKRHQDVATARPTNDDDVKRVRQQTINRRYTVKKYPQQFSSGHSDGERSKAAPFKAVRKASVATQGSVHSPSTSNETASTDQQVLDRLRTSPKTSYVSTGAKTYSTSREPSPVPSPTQPSFQLDVCEPVTSSLQTASGHGSSESHQHLGQVSPQNPLDLSSPQLMAKGSARSSARQSPASGAPNFSVPSFSKRYSSAHSTPPLSTASSSSASNLPRKSMSPPAINEHQDMFDGTLIDVDPAQITDTNRLEVKLASGNEEDLYQPYDQNSAAYPQTLQCFPPDKPVPRRFSSLEYSRGISPVQNPPPRNPSPHPPPTSALPALPESTDLAVAAPRKLRRPISMQVHPSSPLLPPTTTADPLPPLFHQPPSRDPPPPPPPSQQSSQNINKIQNRRSMPHLSRPPYDPPNCPLPTPPVPRLPPIKLSTGSLRRSVERPWRAEVGNRAVGLAE
ncbi:MAG: hypothetical protein Q9220_003792 [cf. Caloplaca sp. 1 TL-2023]